MKVTEAVKGRRSIRRYLDKPIDLEKAKEIIENALWAPSPMNRQPWHFVIISNEENYLVLKQAVKESYTSIEKKLEEIFADKPYVLESTKLFFESMGGAPLGILAFLDSTYESQEEFSMVQGVSAVLQNICLLAYSEGLGTCWLTAPLSVEEKIRSIIGKKLGLKLGRLVALITMGYPREKPYVPPRKAGRLTWL